MNKKEPPTAAFFMGFFSEKAEIGPLLSLKISK